MQRTKCLLLSFMKVEGRPLVMPGDEDHVVIFARHNFAGHKSEGNICIVLWD
jgi:hypothetical protein